MKILLAILLFCPTLALAQQVEYAVKDNVLYEVKSNPVNTDAKKQQIDKLKADREEVIADYDQKIQELEEQYNVINEKSKDIATVDEVNIEIVNSETP